MPTYTPYPIDVTAYDPDAVLWASANVVAYNVNTKESTTATTNSSGATAVDLSNLTSGYTNGDHIQITVYLNGKSGSARHTVDTGAGSGSVTVYSDDIPEQFNTCHLCEIQAAVTTAGTTVKVYNRSRDFLIASIRGLANTTSDLFFGDVGKPAIMGLIIVKSRSDVEVTARIR